MYKMLIADDEKIIRESLSAAIDWTSLGVEVTAVCADGIELYNAILDEYPDIVITDIMMPGLTGLELIEKIQKIDNSIQFILLSGYREFEYAKQAVRLGVCEYLLKPCREEELTASVRNVCRQLDSRRKAPDIAEEYSDLKSSQSWASLRCEIFEALTSDRLAPLDRVPRLADSSIVQIELSSLSPEQAGRLLHSQTSLTERLNAKIIFLSGNTLVFLAPYFPNTDYNGIIHSLQLACGFPEPAPACARHWIWEDNEASFVKLIAKLQSRNRLYSIDSCGVLREIVLRSVPKPEISQLLSLLLTDNEAQVEYKPFINQIIDYCRDHLDYSDLSLKYMAENILFMNVNYLSREFSKTTGETFSAFLTRVRMERAKALLLQFGEEKISSISKQCGYENPQYFSQVFRKYYGVSPSIYLQSVHN